MFRDCLDAVQSLLDKPPPLVLVLDVPRRRNLVYWVGGIFTGLGRFLTLVRSISSYLVREPNKQLDIKFGEEGPTAERC